MKDRGEYRSTHNPVFVAAQLGKADARPLTTNFSRSTFSIIAAMGRSVWCLKSMAILLRGPGAKMRISTSVPAPSGP
eukprot:scaffold303469_cov30-Tisochrysis_lutea.AAC.2